MSFLAAAAFGYGIGFAAGFAFECGRGVNRWLARRKVERERLAPARGRFSPCGNVYYPPPMKPSSAPPPGLALNRPESAKER